MKSQFTLWCLMLFCASNAVAAVFTVSADENHPAQFTTLQAAHDVAAAGDTIQWYGAVGVGTPTFSKPLVIHGSNTYVFGQINFTSTASGSIIIGGTYGQITGPTNQGLLNLEVRNSIVNRVVDLSDGGHAFVNCIINDALGLNRNMIYSNCIFSNSNVFFPGVSDPYTGLYLYCNNNSVFDRCLFLTPMNYITGGVMLFANCIFTAGFYGGLCFNSNSSFDNNMFVGFSVDDTQFCGANIAPNNIMNAPDPFVNGSLTNLATINFELNAASAGNNAALDGTDIGLYGGPNAWPSNFVNGLSTPGIPNVNFLGLQNYVIGISDQLNINAQGSIPSNE